MKPKDVRVLRVNCGHSEGGRWRVHLLEEEWKALSESYDRIFQDRYDLLTVHTKEGMLASEWLMRTATAERERDEARHLLRAVAAACRGLGPRTDAVLSVVGNALAQLDEARAELDEERENVRTLTTHVETLREAWQGASKAVTKLGEQLNAALAEQENRDG